MQQKIVLFDGKILDGVNRWRACMNLDTLGPGSFTEFHGHEPIAYVVSANTMRRDLTISQRASIAADLANMRSGARTDKGLPQNTKSIEAAAKELNVSRRSVVTKAVRKADPALANDVKQGKTKLAKAAKIVTKRSPAKRTENGEPKKSGVEIKRHDGRMKSARYKLEAFIRDYSDMTEWKEVIEAIKTQL